MATLEEIQYTPRTPEVIDGRIQWTSLEKCKAYTLPQICWEGGVTWGEANLWALELATSRRDPKTALRSMRHLHSYAKWLEQENVKWWHFPEKESGRCLNLFRGALVQARNDGNVAPSTASQRMAAVIRFYRWVKYQGLLSTEWPMWNERSVGIKLKNAFGLEHTLRLATTDLAIPNRKVAGAIQLEDGLLPVSRAARQQILDLADSEATEELALMLRLGFLTGLRIGSIIDLKVETVLNATFDEVSGWCRLAVGPRARPVVATKFGVSGSVPCPPDLRERLLEYSTSTRRLKREAQASPEHRRLLFLTRFGQPYSGNSRAVNVEMSRLREAGLEAGLDVLKEFHFHRSRATFATELMRIALQFWSVADAVALVREACLHKDEATTLKYVRFIENTKAQAEAADAFTEAFLGLARAKGCTDA